MVDRNSINRKNTAAVSIGCPLQVIYLPPHLVRHRLDHLIRLEWNVQKVRAQKTATLYAQISLLQTSLK